MTVRRISLNLSLTTGSCAAAHVAVFLALRHARSTLTVNCFALAILIAGAKVEKKGNSAPAETVKTMKSNAPWSVKGIERDARETAKEAARREGMTVGEWLNQMIYISGDPQSSNGEIEGLKLADLVTAIEHLNKRLGEMESASAAAVSELSRNIGGVVERTQRLERVKPAEGSSDDLAARLERLERDGGDRQRVDALKALEKAVTQVAVQFNNAHKTSLERIDANERQLQELAARIDQAGGDSDASSGVAFLKDAIDGLSTRITRAERIASEATKIRNDAAASVDPEFVEQTGSRLRILGDEIKRGGDQIRALEGVISKLADQIDAAELRSAEGVQKVTETMTELREQLSGESGREASRSDIDAAIDAAREETDARIATLQDSLSDVIGRLENVGAGSKAQDNDEGEETEAEAKTATPLAFDISDDVERMIGDAGPDQDTVEETAISEDADEDPFSFDDDEEPVAAGATDGEQSDDFSFDFDDDPEAGEPDEGDLSESSAANQARALLSEVQEAFSGGKSGSKSVEDTSSTPEAADLDAAESDEDDDEEDDDDLDSIFADLDALTANSETQGLETAGESTEAAPASAETENQSARAAAKAMLAGKPPVLSAEPSPEAEGEDYLKAARRRAKEATQHAVVSGKPLRRKLTPKQKAILAARARQKRRIEAEEDGQDQSPAAQGAAPETDAAEAAAAGNDKKGLSAKLTGALASITSRFARQDKSDDADKKPEASDLDFADPQTGDKAAFATIKATVTARPVTLALGVAIILAAAALFFLVKDLVFKPGANNAPPSITASQPAVTAPVNDGTEIVAALPTAPAINPRTLYTESMTALNAAGSDTDNAAAIAKLQDAAALGYPPAQLQLGELYKTGQGVDQDLGQARLWFRRAANGGNVLATHRIGVMTARGDGGAADTREAISWFERAANFGLVDSQYNLGAIYHPSGDGAASAVQDAGQAYYWYSLAAKNGDQQAGPLAAGVAVALSAAQRQDVDAAIAAWAPQTPDPAANEISTTN